MVPRVKEETNFEASNSRNASPLLPTQALKKLYGMMLKSRMVTEARARGSRSNSGSERSLEHSVGLEATEIAGMLDLVKRDTVVACGREMLVRLAAGESLKLIYRKRQKDRRRIAKSAGPSRLALDVIASPDGRGMRLGLGTGVALAYQLLRRRNVVLAIVHTDSSAADLPHDWLKVAADRKLPIVYVVVTKPSQAGRTLTDQVWEDPNVLPTIVVDGNDPVAVYRVAHEAIDHARSGGGSTIIECKTQKWFVADGSSATSSSHDPIQHLEHYLTTHGLWSDEWKNSLVREFDSEINEVFGELRES